MALTKQQTERLANYDPAATAVSQFNPTPEETKGFQSMVQTDTAKASPSSPSGSSEDNSGGMTDYERYLVTSAQNAESTRQRNATEVMKALMTQYGLTSLYSKVVGYIQDGYDPESIAVLIRTTPEYKTRFP